MASYRTTTPGTTAELSDGSKVGNDIVTHTTVNGQTLAKGSGSITFREVNADGTALQGARSYSYSFGQTIALGA